MTDTPPDDDALEGLLEYLRDSRGFDFTGYKRASLRRRIDKRMGTAGLDTFEGYQDYLEVHPHEFRLLFDTILIKVTSFFRDPEHWDYLATEILPRIIEQTPSDEPIRAWCVGCASGAEAYTLAMILAEQLGADAFRERVKLYATDLDDGALATARAGSYDAGSVEETVPAHLRDAYFTRDGDHVTFRTDLRRAIIFGHHDLVTDAPISRLDLLVCRNVLMYFNADTQQRIVANLHFALRDRGALFLGKAEMLLAHHQDFETVSLAHRVFRRAPGSSGPRGWLQGRRVGTPPSGEQAVATALDEAIFEAGPQAQIVLDGEDRLVRANAAARHAFDLQRADLGRPFRDLQLSYHPLELRSRVEEVRETGGSVHATDVQRTRDGTSQHLDVQVVPLADGAPGERGGIAITFEDTTRTVELRADLQRSREELTAAQEELQATYEELQSTNEELETTNEELQSTNEELETTNEELQSTNEELETMNEELQSTNAEQSAVNDQLTERTELLDRVNLFLNSILGSVNVGIVVLDHDQAVQVWNEQATELWGLQSQEVEGQPFFDLDIGLPVDELRAAVRRCETDGSRVEVDAVDAHDRRGRTIQCRITVTPLVDPAETLQGVVVVMEQIPSG